jgi:hypothetical protein
LRVSIDTCILFDLVLDQNPESILKLKRHRDDRDIMVICGTVYGEIHPVFKQNKLDENLFLSDLGIKVQMCGKEEFAYAGEKWMEYTRKRRFVCPACSTAFELACPHCNAVIRFRQHILSDFVIGAFSELRSDGLLTRDYGYYRTYFPNLKRL